MRLQSKTSPQANRSGKESIVAQTANPMGSARVGLLPLLGTAGEEEAKSTDYEGTVAADDDNDVPATSYWYRCFYNCYLFCVVAANVLHTPTATKNMSRGPST